MAVPKETIWEAEPHTLAKHAILRQYLEAWFPILGTTTGRVIYFDGFSGPGEYKGGEPGSPLIALKAAAMYHDLFKGEAIFYFVDNEYNRIEHLKSKLHGFDRLNKFVIVTECDEFESVLNTALDELDKAKSVIAPTFAFIDPFGFKGLPMELIHRLLSHKSTEALINFNLNNVNRFVEHPNSETQDQIIQLFGTSEVIEVIRTSSNRYDDLRTIYQKQLGKAARFVRFFSMKNEKDRPIYDLFFAGNHPKGHYRMKGAMWKVDPEAGLRFSDATDINQGQLFEADPASKLLRQITNRYGQFANVEVVEILEWVRDETAFLESHMREALKRGEGKRLLVKTHNKDGTKRRKGSFKPQAIVDFTWRPAPKVVQGDLFNT